VTAGFQVHIGAEITHHQRDHDYYDRRGLLSLFSPLFSALLVALDTMPPCHSLHHHTYSTSTSPRHHDDGWRFGAARAHSARRVGCLDGHRDDPLIPRGRRPTSTSPPARRPNTQRPPRPLPPHEGDAKRPSPRTRANYYNVVWGRLHSAFRTSPLRRPLFCTLHTVENITNARTFGHDCQREWP
jgi:hypothetical protein